MRRLRIATQVQYRTPGCVDEWDKRRWIFGIACQLSRGRVFGNRGEHRRLPHCKQICG
jgi:hypothetical protein